LWLEYVAWQVPCRAVMCSVGIGAVLARCGMQGSWQAPHFCSPSTQPLPAHRQHKATLCSPLRGRTPALCVPLLHHDVPCCAVRAVCMQGSWQAPHIAFPSMPLSHCAVIRHYVPYMLCCAVLFPCRAPGRSRTQARHQHSHCPVHQQHRGNSLQLEGGGRVPLPSICHHRTARFHAVLCRAVSMQGSWQVPHSGLRSTQP
jgi:hypothetical protein